MTLARREIFNIERDGVFDLTSFAQWFNVLVDVGLLEGILMVSTHSNNHQSGILVVNNIYITVYFPIILIFHTI